VTGDSVFGTGATGLLSTTSGSQGILAQIAQDLQTGTPASLASATGSGLQSLNQALSTVEDQAAQLGSQYQQMTALQTQATDSQTALTSQLSNMQNVNLAQATTSLQQQQTSYQAALWAASQLVQPSLVSFLS